MNVNFKFYVVNFNYTKRFQGILQMPTLRSPQLSQSLISELSIPSIPFNPKSV